MTDLSALSDDDLLRMYNQPRGYRNNNPLNMKPGGQFAVYSSMDEGLKAADDNLRAYGTKHGINTIAGAVHRWAPPEDNNDPEAYARFVSQKTGIDPHAPIDLAGDADTRRALLGAMAEFENGSPLPESAAKPDLSHMSDAELLAAYNGQGAPATAAPAVATRPASAPQSGLPAPVRKDQMLGLQKGAFKPLDNAAVGAEWLLDKLTGSNQPGRFSHMMGLASAKEVADGRAAHVAGQARKGVVPGKIGEFAGNVLGTLPLAALPGGALTQGAASGAALSDAKTARGLATDTAVGAVAGKAADFGLQALGKAANGLLGKAPKIMDVPALKAAVGNAYDKVRAAGIVVPKADAQALSGDIHALIRAKGGPKAARLYADADALAARLKSLAEQKGGLPITQLEELRADIYSTLVKPGGKEAPLGVAMRQKIDGLMDTVAAGNPLLREARELNTRLAKATAVTKRLDSADLAKRRAYTGSNGDNTIRQKMSPLIDPLHSARLRNATADEAKALDRVVTGGPMQNLARTVGALGDPRRGIPGASLLTSVMGAPHTGGLSLATMPLGMASTAMANRTSQKNVQELLKLIAAGGSKQALKKVQTPASKAALAAAQKARLGSGLIGASAAAQFGGL